MRQLGGLLSYDILIVSDWTGSAVAAVAGRDLHRILREALPNRPGEAPLLVKLTVEDTGIGIPEEKAGRIFEEFIQADASTTRKYEGTGLGLAICRRLVALMGGEMGMRSRVGEGSTSWFTLTLGLDAEALVVPEWTAGLDGAKVLLVDEYKPSRTALEEQIRDLGVRVESCATGDEALDSLRAAWARGQPFDAVISDPCLFVADGELFLHRMRADATLRAIPVVRLTSLHGVEVVRRIVESEPAQYLFRPVRLGQLAEVVMAALAEPRSAPFDGRSAPQLEKHHRSRVDRRGSGSFG